MKKETLYRLLLLSTVAVYVLMTMLALGHLMTEQAHAQTVQFAFDEPKPHLPAPEVVAAFLEARGSPELARHAAQIVKLPRWSDALALAGAETSFCTAGVGTSRKNCGAIKNARGEFKIYASELDGIEDISVLLSESRYEGKDFKDMNGVYCVSDQEDKQCDGWTERVEALALKINSL